MVRFKVRVRARVSVRVRGYNEGDGSLPASAFRHLPPAACT